MLLELDLHPGRETRAQELPTNGVAEARFGQQQEIVARAPHDPKRRDDPRLRRQQQGVAIVVRRDVVGDHALQEILRVRPRDAHELARTSRNAGHGI